MSCNCAYCIRFLSQSSLKPGLIPFMETALNLPFFYRFISLICSALRYVPSASLGGSIFRSFNLLRYVDFPIRACLVDLRLSPKGEKSCFPWNSRGNFKSGLHIMSYSKIFKCPIQGLRWGHGVTRDELQHLRLGQTCGLIFWLFDDRRNCFVGTPGLSCRARTAA